MIAAFTTVLSCTLFLLWVNALPPLISLLCGDRWNRPLDGGRWWRDQQPILGPHKTFRGIIATGKDVVPAVIDYCAKAEVLTWPLKILAELLDDDEYRTELIALLDRFDTEYARNVEPKIHVIQALEDVVHDDVRTAIERFFEDTNETVRFHAVQTTFAQGMSESVEALIDLLVQEESVRVKNKIADGLLVRGWTIPEARRDAVADALADTSGYGVGEGGKVVKRSRLGFG
jgi:hypothetical protein